MKGVVECIILGRRKFGDSSFIVSTYSKSIGRADFLIQGVSPKSKNKRKGHLEPLSHVEISYSEGKGGLLYGREIKSLGVWHGLGEDIRKSSIAMFTVEILSQCLNSNQPDEKLFEFIQLAVSKLNSTNVPANWHVWFLLHLTQYLGCEPSMDGIQDRQYFDIADGCFADSCPSHGFFLEPQACKSLKLFMLDSQYEAVSELHLSAQARKILLDGVIRYYELHLETLRDIKSLEVLETVFA